MKISSKAHYGLQAVFLLAKKDGVLSAKELEKEMIGGGVALLV